MTFAFIFSDRVHLYIIKNPDKVSSTLSEKINTKVFERILKGNFPQKVSLKSPKAFRIRSVSVEFKHAFDIAFVKDNDRVIGLA